MGSDITIVVLSEDRDGSSLKNIGEQMKQYAPEGSVFPVYRSADAFNHDYVLCLKPEDLIRYAANWRMRGKSKFGLFFTPNPEEFSDAQIAATLLSCIQLDAPIVCHSPGLLKDLSDRAVALLSRSHVKKVQESLHYVPWGVSPDFTSEKGNRDFWMAPFNRWNSSQKQAQKHAELTSTLTVALAARGHTVVSQMNVGRDLVHPPDEYARVYQIVECPSFQEYVEQCKQAGMFLCTSRYESFGIMYLELLCAGSVGVFLDRPWVRDLLPGYPYIAKSREEFLAMALHVHKNHEDVYEKVMRATAKKIRAMYSIPKFVESTLGVLTNKPQ